LIADERPLAGRRILVVEDNIILAETLAMNLEDDGAEIVGPAGNVKDALALIAESGRLDCAVLDVNLRREQVYPVAEILRASGVRIVLLTGEGAVQPKFADVPCLQKPATPKQLMDALLG
jgi:CheY-like chemotaxis protein